MQPLSRHVALAITPAHFGTLYLPNGLFETEPRR